MQAHVWWRKVMDLLKKCHCNKGWKNWMSSAVIPSKPGILTHRRKLEHYLGQLVKRAWSSITRWAMIEAKTLNAGGFLLCNGLICCDTSCCGLAQWKDWIVEQWEEEEVRYSEVEKANTQFNVISPIKQIVCTSRGEERRYFIKLWRSTIRNTYTSR